MCVVPTLAVMGPRSPLRNYNSKEVNATNVLVSTDSGCDGPQVGAIHFSRLSIFQLHKFQVPFLNFTITMPFVRRRTFTDEPDRTP